MLSNHLIFCHPLLLLPSIFSNIRVFSNESVLYTRQPKYWSFSISTSKEYSGCFSFRIDLFDLLAVQGILKSLLRNHSLKASILQCSAFFVVSGPDPTASHYQPMPPPETPRHTQASLAQCLLGLQLLSPDPGAHTVLCSCPSVLFPQSWVNSVIKSCSPSKSDSLGTLSPCARPPGWEVCCGA